MTTDRLTATFAALADPTRRAILARVAAGDDISVGELAAPFDMSLPAISKHLKVLERAGLIARGRDAQRRPCRLKAEPLKDAARWIGEYRQHWERNLERLDDYLHKLHGHKLHGHKLHGQELHAKSGAAKPKKRTRSRGNSGSAAS